MLNEASARSTLDTLTFGKSVNRVLSEEGANSVVRTFRSVTFNVAEAGKNPLEIPVTAVTPDTVT